MAWIESHQALGHHPKTLKLAAELKCRVPEAVGYLHFFWWWALDYAADGVVEPSARTHVAQACLWRGKPDTFWSALAAAGFVECDGDQLKIHDWMDYAGRLVEKRAANAARMKRARNAHSAGLPLTNQPYQPEPTDLPDQPNPPNPPSDQPNGGCCPLGTITDGAQHSTFCENAATVPA